MSQPDLEASVWEAVLAGTNAAEALALAKRCVREPEAIETVAEASRSDTLTTRAFAFHTLKHVATLKPTLLEQYRETILDIGHEGEFWAVPLLSAQIVSRLDWPLEWHVRVRAVFQPYLDSTNKFAAAWALRALWPLAEPGSELQTILLEACDRFLAMGGAPAASARILMRRPVSGGKAEA